MSSIVNPTLASSLSGDRRWVRLGWGSEGDTIDC